MSIWVIIDTFRTDDVIRKPENAILAFLLHHYYVKIMSMLFQQLCHIIIQHISRLNKSFNLNREILSKLWLKSLKIGSTLLQSLRHCSVLGPSIKFFYTEMWDIKLCFLSEIFM